MKNTSSDDVYFCENCKSLIFFEEPFKETDHYYLFLNKKRNLLNIEISEKFLLFEKEAFFPLCHYETVNCKNCDNELGFVLIGMKKQYENYRNFIFISRETLLKSEDQENNEDNSNSKIIKLLQEFENYHKLIFMENFEKLNKKFLRIEKKICEVVKKLKQLQRNKKYRLDESYI